MNPILKNAFVNAVGATTYIVTIVLFLFYAPKTSGHADIVFVPIMMLMLLVFSVAIMGLLFFGRPILWYLEGQKQEAVTLFASTLLVFLVIMLVVFFCFIIF